MKPDFSSYKTRSRYALQINQGYSAHLNGIPRDQNPYTGAEADAWWFGWDEYTP